MNPKRRESSFPPLNHRLAIACFLTVCLVSAGCSMSRSSVREAAAVAVGAGAGGALAHELSDGDPGITALGAAGGAVIGHLAAHDEREATQTGFDQGYVQGQSDAIKRQYFLRHNLEKKPLVPNAGGEAVYYTLPVSQPSGGGGSGSPGTVTVRIIE